MGVVSVPVVAAGGGGDGVRVSEPSSADVRVRYAVPVRGSVSLRIYDVTGRMVHELASRRTEPGSFSAVWNGRDQAGRPVGSGVYFLRVETAAGAATSKVTLVQ